MLTPRETEPVIFSVQDIGFGVGLILLNVNCSNYAEENCARYEGFDREASTCCCKCDGKGEGGRGKGGRGEGGKS